MTAVCTDERVPQKVPTFAKSVTASHFLTTDEPAVKWAPTSK
jgi:hypothetical protein